MFSSSSSTGIESLASAVSDLQTLKGIQGGRSGMRHSVLWENRQIDIFRGNFYELEFLHLPILRKALKSLTEISVPHD